MRFLRAILGMLLCASPWAAVSTTVALAQTAERSAAGPVLGLAVQPGGLLIQEVVPGETYDFKEKTGIGLTIFNRDGRDRVYVLSTHRPSESGSRRLPPGYSDLPDPAWLRFDREEMLVPAQGSVEVRMYLAIPADSRYWNQHWSVSVGVVGKATPGEMINLAAYPRFEIETAPAPRRELKLRPVGEIGLVPSRLTFARMTPGSRREAECIVCNNDKRRHWFRFSVLAEGVVSADQRIVATGDSRWMPLPEWVRVREDKIWLAKWQTRSMALRVRLPRTAEIPAEGWEAIILVQRDDGRTGFVRLLVTPQATTEIGGQG